MDAKKPEEILSLKVDADPDKYIKATGYPGYSEKVEVAPGTKVNMRVTDRNGNPVQVAATFGRDAQGNTTADVQVIPRPDLTPASAEAPHAQPPPEVSPAENPANNPDDENPGTRPNPEPDPDLNPDANPDTDGQPGTSPDSPSSSGPPKRQASQRKETRRRRRAFVRLFSGNPSLSGDGQTFGPHACFDDISIPQVTDDKTWFSHNFLPSNGVCPQPKTFHVFGRQYRASYEPLCVFAEKSVLPYCSPLSLCRLLSFSVRWGNKCHYFPV
ncbi:IgG-binding virulence factor TspB family protein [Neisseria gonorrhoeae]|nr:IgG-binding virulence factor TspB family protein [Neisseria gonorrhoeae]UYA63283.1 IgG-binding virulence factor TspB family protein [Neisseria gonorrhoeae]